jgi:hypothetical protein
MSTYKVAMNQAIIRRNRLAQYIGKEYCEEIKIKLILI